MKQCWHCFAREPNVSSDKRSTSGTHLPRLIPLHIGKSNYAMLAKTSPDPIGTDPGAQVLSGLIRRKFRSFALKSLLDSQSHCQNASLHGTGLRPAPSGPASGRLALGMHWCRVANENASTVLQGGQTPRATNEALAVHKSLAPFVYTLEN